MSKLFCFFLKRGLLLKQTHLSETIFHKRFSAQESKLEVEKLYVSLIKMAKHLASASITI